MTPSARRLWHDLSSANMAPWMSVDEVVTSTHRRSPLDTFSLCPSNPLHCMSPPSGGFSDQNEVTPFSLAYPKYEKACLHGKEAT